MKNTTPSYNSSGVPAFSRSDLIKNLINLLAFKYETARKDRSPLQQDTDNNNETGPVSCKGE